MNSRTRYGIRIFSTILLAATQSATSGAVTVYDNLDFPHDLPVAPIGPKPDAGDLFLAQPFLTDEHGIVTSASVLLQRVGSPTGMMHADIWSDDGGTPGVQIGRLGSVDVTTLALEPTAVTFDETVALESSSTYFLVMDLFDLNLTTNDSMHLGMRASNEGTSGAGRSLVTAPNTTDQWLILADLLPGSNYLRMQVNSIPEPSALSAFAIVLALGFVFRRRLHR